MDFMDNFLTIHTRRQIATITGVSERTAQRWISKKTKPPKSAMRLLLLHDAGRVMPLSWAKTNRFVGDYLDIGHKQNLSHQQVGWYFYSCHLWHLMLDRIPLIEARLDALIKVCPPAEVINLQAYKDELERVKKRPFAMPANYIEPHELTPRLTTRMHGC